jgi:hypothetical protein
MRWRLTPESVRAQPETTVPAASLTRNAGVASEASVHSD